MHPKISIEYKMHYISKQLSDWPGNGGLQYQIGNKLFFGTAENGMAKIKSRGTGWNGKEDWGDWTDGKDAHVYLIINENIMNNLIMTIDTTTFYPDGKQKVDICIDGIKVSTLYIENSVFKDYQVIIPKDLIKRGKPIDIQFIINNPLSPSQYGSKDTRLLGMGVKWIQIDTKFNNANNQY